MEERDTYYFAIPGDVGWHKPPHWTHYTVVGTKSEVKKMYAKYFLKDKKVTCSFRDYVQYLYEEYDVDYDGEDITDDMIMDYLDDQRFDIATDQNNDGWKKVSELSESDLCTELVDSEPVPIEFDDDFTFDTSI